MISHAYFRHTTLFFILSGLDIPNNTDFTDISLRDPSEIHLKSSYLKEIFIWRKFKKENRRECNAWSFLWSSLVLFFFFLLSVSAMNPLSFLFLFLDYITTLAYLSLRRCGIISLTNSICKIFFWLLGINPRATFMTESLSEIMTNVIQAMILVVVRKELLSWSSPTGIPFIFLDVFSYQQQAINVIGQKRRDFHHTTVPSTGVSAQSMGATAPIKQLVVT